MRRFDERVLLCIHAIFCVTPRPVFIYSDRSIALSAARHSVTFLLMPFRRRLPVVADISKKITNFCRRLGAYRRPPAFARYWVLFLLKCLI